MAEEMDGGIERIGRLRFRQRPAPVWIEASVVSVWRAVAETDTTLRLVPDGCVELVRSRASGDVRIFGPATRWRDLRLAAGADHDGVRLRVGAAAAVLRTDLPALRDRVEDAESLELPAALTRCPGRPEWFDALWRQIAENTTTGRDPLVENALPLLVGPGARVGVVARELGVGERRLRRRFEAATGISPTTYRRLARLDDTLGELRAGRPPASVAHSCGYADQAHLNREVLALTGQTPSSLRD